MTDRPQDMLCYGDNSQQNCNVLFKEARHALRKAAAVAK